MRTKKVFTLKVAEHQNRLPREVVESASQDLCLSHTDTFLCALDDPALAGELDSMVS